MKKFKCSEMTQLARELSKAPARLRLRHVSGILRTIQLLDPKREYPFDFISYQVTGYQSKRGRPMSDLPDAGKALIEDLTALADYLTKERPIPAAALPGVLLDTASLSSRFGVSTKTIARWRKRGLVGLWCVADSERPRLCFWSRSVRAFVGRNMELVKRGASFKVMQEGERESLLKRAREIVAATGATTLHAVTQQLADETGRAIETLRYTLRNFDRDHPEQALFNNVEQSQPVEWTDVVYQSFMEGEALSALAERWNVSTARIGEAITQGRVSELRRNPIDYMPCAAFDAKDADKQFLGDEFGADQVGAAQNEDEAVAERIPAGLPAYMEALYRTPLLTPEQERTLFLQMNYRLHRAEKMRQKLVASDEVNTSAVAAIDAEIDVANRLRQRIAQANLRLVVSVAKRHISSEPDRGLFELVSDGNVALMRSIDKFDVMRGFKFSTYATWSIKRAYAKALPQEQSQRKRYRTGHDEFLAEVHDHRPNVLAFEAPEPAIENPSLASSLAALSEQEREVVERRFGLTSAGAAESVEEISQHTGIELERVKSIEAAALAKLRDQLSGEALQRAG